VAECRDLVLLEEEGGARHLVLLEEEEGARDAGSVLHPLLRVAVLVQGQGASARACTALHCTALHCTALHCTALHL
jgi:hypothetical protein